MAGENAPLKLGIADTMFARVDMAPMAVDEIKKNFPRMQIEIVRSTVPGMKDLPVECLRLLNSGCELCMAIGMVGKAPIDTQCAHEASLGMQMAMIKSGKHIVEVFVHENEGESPEDLLQLAENRVRKHALNTVWLARFPEERAKRAGQGHRQGRENAGPLKK